MIRRWFKNGKVVREQTISKEDAERERREAEERYQRTHPPDAPRISGCCDSAKNYIANGE